MLVIWCGLLLVRRTVVIYVDSVEGTTCHVYNFGEVALSIALRFLVCRASLVIKRLDGRIVLLRLSGQVG